MAKTYNFSNYKFNNIHMILLTIISFIVLLMMIRNNNIIQFVEGFYACDTSPTFDSELKCVTEINGCSNRKCCQDKDNSAKYIIIDTKTTTECPKSNCFNNTAKIELESGEKINISDAKIGDKILCYNNKNEFIYSPVIFIPHEKTFHKNSYVKITTENNLSITMTSDHYIPIYNLCQNENVITPQRFIINVKKADELNIGDKIKTKDKSIDLIKTIENVYDYGLSTVLTDNEYIIVDNIVVSSFGGDMSHSLQNKLANILRYSYKVYPKFNELKTVRKIVEFITP